MFLTRLRTEEPTRRVCVIGAGPAGMMAAIHAAQNGAQVTLLERNSKLGKKLRITGKGRCNVTNDCDINTFLTNVPTNFRFLYAALNRFSPSDTKAFFEGQGVELKVERGRRVFPVSDRAADIAEAMVKACRGSGVRIVSGRAGQIERDQTGAVSSVLTDAGKIPCDAVVLCTGGLSYPLTGSDGDGYRMAGKLGHTVTPTVPSLVPMVAERRICAPLQGLSLRNVTLKIEKTASGGIVFEELGEMLFTHFGLSGPLVLSASAHIPDLAPGKYEAVIDLKPGLDEKKLDARLVSDFGKYANRDFLNGLHDLLPQKMIPVFVERTGIDPQKKIHSITKEERRRVVELLKAFRIPLLRFRPIEEAIVTKGGIKVSEINPKTMESKLVPGLYFAGEILDVDAYTGGFNLQIAFSTGVLAGEHAAWGRAE